MSTAKTSAGAGKGERIPKKSGGILCKGNPVELYTFIKENKGTFGLRWLLDKFRIFPNSYYNFLRNRKKAYRERKTKLLALIEEIYHAHNGVDGYRKMRVYLQRHQIFLSNQTVHKYMNIELRLRSIVRRKKPSYQKSSAHKIFPDLLQRDFNAESKNKKWAIDFTYLPLKDRMHYNCTIIDLFDRSVVATLTDSKMTSELAIRTLKAGLKRQRAKLDGLILHSDQGSQFSSHEFTSFCAKVGVKQSMSRAGCPTDNAPIERFFHTLKSEFFYLHDFYSPEILYRAIEDFAYIFYNHVRPHSFNDFMTPFQKRCF